MRLLIKKIDDDGRLSLLSTFLDTAWDIEVVDTEDSSAFDQALSRAHAMVSMNWRWDLPSASDLKLLQLPGAGTDEIDFSRVPAGTAVCNCYEHEIGIAEYVLGAMLEWTIDIRALDREFRQHTNWAGSYLCGPRHGELFGKTVGIVGYGRIGREVARRAKAFGTRVLACTRTPKPDELAESVWGMEHFHALLAAADFVVVTPPLNDQTRGLFDDAAFAAMRSTAVIINVARGAIIDEAAMYNALRGRVIGGAVIDVWYQYPPQGEPRGPRPSSFAFEELDNVLMTPHASAWTDGLLPRRNRAVAMNLNRLARGEPLVNVVKPAS